MAFFLHMKQAIGIFDSGVGGLSLVPAIQEAPTPWRHRLYRRSRLLPLWWKIDRSCFGSSKRNNRCSCTTQLQTNFLVACNTVTTQVIDELRKAYSLPFVGIEPAIKPAVAASKTGVVGVLATKGTFKSALYHQTIAQHASKIKVVEQVGKGLVEMGGKRSRRNGRKSCSIAHTYYSPTGSRNGYTATGLHTLPFFGA